MKSNNDENDILIYILYHNVFNSFKSYGRFNRQLCYRY